MSDLSLEIADLETRRGESHRGFRSHIHRQVERPLTSQDGQGPFA